MADTFTPEQVSQILEEFFKVVGTRQYIGARYVPIFGRKDETSIQWDNSAPYEPLTIVLYQGNSYTSRQYVPTGVDILNEEFWALTGNYNAQVEAYRREVQEFSNRIEAVEDSDVTQNAQLAGTTDSGLKTLINNNATQTTERFAGIDEQLAGTADSRLLTKINDNATGISENGASIAANATHIADTNALLNQLGTQAQQTFAQINGRIDTNASDILELKQELEKSGYEGAKSIGFGDSNMAGGEAGATENVYYRICEKLGCTYDNRGINGATIQSNGDGKDILPSIQNATADPDVKLVVLIGGINDYHYIDYNFTNFSAAARACINEILTKFVNADVVVIWDQGKQQPNARMLRYQDALNGCTTMSRTRNIISVPTYDLAFNASWYASQNHWNGNGCNVVAQRACAYLLGEYPFPALTYRVSVSPESGVSNCSAIVQKIAHLDVVAIDQYVDIHFSENFTASAYSTLFNLPMGIDGKLGSGDTYFDVGYPIGDGKSARFNVRQWQNNYESLTDNPVLIVRNRNAITAADVANEFDIRISIPLRPQQ